MPTFAQIQEEIRNMLEIPDDELTDEQLADMDIYLDELAKQEADKVDAFAQYLKLESARAEALKAESKRHAERAKAVENGLSRLKNHYLRVMAANNLKKVSGDVYTLSIRKNESVNAPTEKDNPEALAALPEIYKRVKTFIQPDKAAIKEGLKAGLEIPGCSLQESFSLLFR